MVLFVKRTKVVGGFLEHPTPVRRGEGWARASDSPLPAQDPLCARSANPEAFSSPNSITTPSPLGGCAEK